MRRLTFRQKSRLQCELYFTFKPEASEIKLNELDLRAFGVSYDLQDDRRREWPAVRFLNAQGKNASSASAKGNLFRESEQLRQLASSQRPHWRP